MKTTINSLQLLNRATNMVIKGYDLNQSLQTSALIETLQFKLMKELHTLFTERLMIKCVKRMEHYWNVLQTEI